MQLKPCARCEQELPPGLFDHPEDSYCKICAKEINALLKKKYGIIRAAHIRAQMRHKTRRMRDQHNLTARMG